jgi:hypothetical protein
MAEMVNKTARPGIPKETKANRLLFPPVCVFVCARLLLSSGGMRFLSVGMFHLFVCLFQCFSFIFFFVFPFILGFYVDAAAEFRKYNVVVYPTDGQGSTYVPVLFRPTGPFNFSFASFILDFFLQIHFGWKMCTFILLDVSRH